MKHFITGGIAALMLMTFANSADSAAANDSRNPLLQQDLLPYGAIPFDRMTAQGYEDAVKEAIKLQNARIAAIVNQRSMPTFENTIVALERSGDELLRASLALGNLEHALGEEDLMQAMQNVTPLLSEHQASILLNQPLWDRIKFVYDHQEEIPGLTPEDKRLLSETYDQFANNGADLKGEDREKYRKLMSELSELNIRFAQNNTNGMKAPDKRLWLTADQLSGIPESIREAAPVSYTQLTLQTT